MDKYIKSLKHTINKAINTSTTLKAFSNQLIKYHIIVSRPFKTTLMHLNLKYYQQPSKDSTRSLKITPNSIKRITPFLSNKISKGLSKHMGQYLRLCTSGLVYYDTKSHKITNASKLGHKYTEKAITKQIHKNQKK